MFSDLQTGVVDVLETARQNAGTPAEGRLVPEAVRAYGGELLRPKKLVRSTPICFVEFDVGRPEAIDYGEYAAGPATLDVICATRNRRSGEAEYSDGVALLTWTFEQLVGLEIDIAEYGTMYWESMSVGRLMSGTDIWAAKVSPDLKLQRY